MPDKTQEKLQEKLDRFYEEQSAHYREIEAMHPGCPDDLEMHWDQVRREWHDPELDDLLEEIGEAGFGTRFNSDTYRMEITPSGSRNEGGQDFPGSEEKECQDLPGREEWDGYDEEEFDL